MLVCEGRPAALAQIIALHHSRAPVQVRCAAGRVVLPGGLVEPCGARRIEDAAGHLVAERVRLCVFPHLAQDGTVNQQAAGRHAISPHQVAHVPVAIVRVAPASVDQRLRRYRAREVEPRHNRYGRLAHVLVEADEAVLRDDRVMLQEEQPFVVAFDGLGHDQVLRIGDLVAQGHVGAHKLQHLHG